MPRLLIVDDIPDNLYMLETLLSGAGHQVLSAHNGIEALVLARKDPPDLLVSDILMPEMDGFALCREWRKDPLLCRIPIVVYTATYTDPMDERLALEMGATRFLLKPMDPNLLLANLEEVLRESFRSRPFPPSEPTPDEETEQLRLYNARLVSKIEQKMLELERTNAELVLQMDERAKAESRLRVSQRMEAVGRLAGGVSHDFNNILAVIINYCEMILDRLEPSNPLRHDVQEILDAGLRACEITSQLLAFCRQRVQRPVALCLNDTLRDFTKMLRRLLGADIEIACVPEDLLGSILADSGQMLQILMNLAVNARDAMPKGGRLTIETANREFDDLDRERDDGVIPGRYVMLSVSDTGTGITPEIQGHIFEPFFTTKEVGHGTGLGLSTVYGIVKQMGGHIHVYSEPGMGTSFKLLFPRVDAAPTEADVRVAHRIDTTGHGTILVVEDDDALRRLSVRILETTGYRVLASSRGDDALALCRQEPGPIDLLFADVILPGMSGPELARQVSALRPGVKVLLSSGYSDNVLAQSGLAGRNLTFIPKPYSAGDLTRSIAELLSPG